MALFDKLFSLKRKLDSDIHEQRNRDRSCKINPEQVRLLLFKECDWRGRKLLFDSSAIQKVPAGKNDKPNIRQTEELPCIVEVSDGFCYMYKGKAADASVLGEMIFGAVAMNYKSVSLKIHIMDEPRRIMCTKIFCVPSSRRISRVERKTSERGDAGSSGSSNGSKPLNVPLLREEGVSLSFSLDRGDSGFYGDYSPYSSVGSSYDYISMFESWDGSQSQDDLYSFHCPPGRKLSTSSNGSWQRRTFQNIATRFDLGHSSSNMLSVPTAFSNTTGSDSQLYSGSSTSGTSNSIASAASSAVQRKSKLGLALLITVTESAEMEVVRRCVEHSPQLQAVVCRLRLATLEAGAGGRGRFVSTLYRAAEQAAMWLSDLIYGPRLQPVWLNLVTSDARASAKIADSLLSDLCCVLSVGDTKQTNLLKWRSILSAYLARDMAMIASFGDRSNIQSTPKWSHDLISNSFISTLLTHVLTYHLGWVTTVSPYDTVDYQRPTTDSTADPRRPYNALWAQLGDLCGSIGFPPRAARTVISGANNAKFINRLLVVLTYFMRCGDVRRTDFHFQNSAVKEEKVIRVDRPECSLKRTATRASGLAQWESRDSLKVPVNTQNSDSSVSTLVASDVSMKRSTTLANLSQKLSNSAGFAAEDGGSTSENPMNSQLRRNPTMMLSSKASSDSSLNSSVSDFESEQKVVFVLGDNEKLVGLKNKSGGGKSVKKSSKVQNESPDLDAPRKNTEGCTKESCDQVKSADSPSKCCGQTLQHSKPIKHSGFKFEFDKYPQIVTNYMKSKNLEILDRHYIGKPGNLKLDNFQFDPTVVPPIQEERCETCVKCQLMESMLQTPTNASEMEYMNDIPRQSEPQYAKEAIVKSAENHREMSPKTFVRRKKENTVIVNVITPATEQPGASVDARRPEGRTLREKEKDRLMEVKQVIEFPVPRLCMTCGPSQRRSGFDGSLLGGVTDHYVPDLILQGTTASPKVWEMDLRRDLDLTSYLSKTVESPLQAVAIVGDITTWEVHVVGRDCGSGGMSSLVGAMLDALTVMWRAKVPAHKCLSFLEGKLREFCVLSKTLADMLMSTDFCDIATLTKCLNVDANDVPLLLAVATTHTPQVATRYGLSYR